MNTTAKVLKNINSLDDRGIFCTEVHAKDALHSSDSFAHVHNNIELIYSVDANVDIRTSTEKFSLSRGELIVISPMEKHFQSIEGSGLYYSVKFLPSILFSSDQTFSEYKFFNQFISLHGKRRLYSKKDLDDCNIASLFDDIMREWSSKDPGYELMIRANILKIFTALARCKDSDCNSAKTEYSNNAINTALAYISENSATATERSVAEHCGLSLAYFSTLFKNTVGVHFGEYLMQLKLGRAKSLLLTTDKSITYIAYETGFSSSSHFIARFRELEGITPASYRMRAQTEGAIDKIKAPAFTAQFPSVGEGEDITFGFFESRGGDRFETLPLPQIEQTSQKSPIVTHFRSGREIFSDASSNGISLRKVELLSDDNTEYTRIWSP